MASSSASSTAYGEVPLAYQRVGQQRPQRDLAVAGAGGLDGQDPRTPSRPAPGRASPAPAGRRATGWAPARSTMRRHLDHRLVRQPGDGAVVAHVDVVVRAVAGEQRGDQGRGRLAVVGTAALLEQLGLVVELSGRRTSRAASARSRGPPRPACGRPLRLDRLVGAVEVVQVVRRDRADRRASARPGSRCRRPARRAPRRSSSSGSRSTPVDHDPADPGQVVEPDVLEPHLVGADAEPRGEPALEADGDVAQAERAVAFVEQGAGDDADRVGEVDDPGAGLRPAGGRPRRCRAPPAPYAVPWRSRRGRSSPGRAARTCRESSRRRAGPAVRRPAAGAAPRPPPRRRRPATVVTVSSARKSLLVKDSAAPARRRRRAGRRRCRAAPARRRRARRPVGRSLRSARACRCCRPRSTAIFMMVVVLDDVGRGHVAGRRVVGAEQPQRSGVTVEQTSMASGQRSRKRQPGVGSITLGGSPWPASASTASGARGSGTAESNSWVYGCFGSAEDVLGRPGLDDVPGVHDHQPVGDVAGAGDVVGDVEERDALLARASWP